MHNIISRHQLRGSQYDFTYIDVEPLCECECTANKVCRNALPFAEAILHVYAVHRTGFLVCFPCNKQREQLVALQKEYTKLMGLICKSLH